MENLNFTAHVWVQLSREYLIYTDIVHELCKHTVPKWSKYLLV